MFVTHDTFKDKSKQFLSHCVCECWFLNYCTFLSSFRLKSSSDPFFLLYFNNRFKIFLFNQLKLYYLWKGHESTFFDKNRQYGTFLLNCTKLSCYERSSLNGASPCVRMVRFCGPCVPDRNNAVDYTHSHTPTWGPFIPSDHVSSIASTGWIFSPELGMQQHGRDNVTTFSWKKVLHIVLWLYSWWLL